MKSKLFFFAAILIGLIMGTASCKKEEGSFVKMTMKDSTSTKDVFVIIISE